MLESGKFTPARSVVLAFGFDEETGGKVVSPLEFYRRGELMTQGALYLGKWLEEKYGKDSMALLIDEGSGMEELFGQVSHGVYAYNTAADLSSSPRLLSAKRDTSMSRSEWRPSADTAPSRVSSTLPNTEML